MKPRGPALMWLTSMFMTGIACAGRVAVCEAILAVLSAALLLLARSVRERVWSRSVLTAVICLCTGIVITHAHQYLASDDIARHAGAFDYRPLTVEGVVVSEVRRRELVNTVKTSFTLRIERVTVHGQVREISGRVLVNLFAPVDVICGDRLRVTGRLHRPFEFAANDNFSYRRYLQNKGVHYILSVKRGNPVEVTGRDARYQWRAAFLRARQGLINHLRRYLTPNESGIMQAILLGERSEVPPHVRELFVRTGTAHVLAVSGLHVGIVVLLVMIAVQVMRLPRRVQFIVTILFILMYVVLTGARPSIIRAAVMSIVFIGSLIYEREANSLAMLSCASLLILLGNPLNLYDIGFQLSFACILSMITIGRRLEGVILPWTEKHGVKGWRRRLVRALIISFAVWVGVEGLVMYHFNLITPVSVLANLFVIPLIFAVVLLGMGLIGAALAWPWMAVQAALCLKAVLSVMVAVTFLCSRIPGAYMFVSPPDLTDLAVYYVIIGMIFGVPWGIIGSKFNRFRLRPKN